VRPRAEARADDIVDVVVDLLESEGYDAVQVRTVARRARISLATMYKLFGTRDELIVTALERWLDAHAYAALTMPEPGESYVVRGAIARFADGQIAVTDILPILERALFLLTADVRNDTTAESRPPQRT
jgi:AcrR family transcriptional regulator